MASNAAPKKSRISAPKRRTGCITCKIRRVKCDERRPVCARCEKGQYTCDGYETVIPPRRKAGCPPLPKSERDLGGLDSHQTRFFRNPVTVALSERDASYFDLFRLHIADDISGYGHSEFWTKGILRDSMAGDECIRHSILGISALCRALYLEPEEIKQNSTLKPSGAAVVNDHHEAALSHYGKALAIFRDRVKNVGHNPSPWLVVPPTLLFLAFEFLQGRVDAVDNLLSTAIMLFRDSFQADLSSTPQTRERSEPEDVLCHMSVSTGLTPFFPAQRQYHSFMDTRPFAVPPSNASLSTISRAWRSMYARGTTLGSRLQWSRLSGNEGDLAAATEDHTLQVAELQRWRAFFNNRARPEDERRSLDAMHIQCVASNTFVAGSMDSTSLAYDDYLENFVELHERCERYITEDAPAPRIGFTLDMGILSSVCFVAGTCRDPEVRVRALRLLETLPPRWKVWREGPWDARLLAKGFRALVELEEAGRDPSTGFLWPDERYKWVGMEIGDNGTLIGVYKRITPDDNGERAHVRVELCRCGPGDLLLS